jgi:multisubunit Na+/H+ antiporter MnhB subunit
MDPYNSKPKQQSRSLLVIVGSLTAVLALWYLLSPTGIAPPLAAPVVTKVSYALGHRLNLSNYVSKGCDGAQR